MPIINPDWVPPVESTFDVKKPIRSEQGLILAGNPIAIAEGAPGAPRIVPDALNFRSAVYDPSGLSEVLIPAGPNDWTIEFSNIKPNATADRTLSLSFSTNGGATYGISATVSSSGNWFAGGLFGFVKGESLMLGAYAARSGLGVISAPEAEAGVLGIRTQSTDTYTPVDLIRVQWSSGLFATEDDQRIYFYQGGNRPLGGKP